MKPWKDTFRFIIPARRTPNPPLRSIFLPAVVFSGVDLTATSVRTLRVQGQVINGVTGQPALNANVMLIPRHAQPAEADFAAGSGISAISEAAINNQGAFDIRGVPPGSYEVIAVLNERNNRMTARLPLEIGNSDVQNVSLVISPGFTLTGRLAIEGQQPGGAIPRSPECESRLRPDSAAQIAGAPPAAPVQADGTFSLQQVGPRRLSRDRDRNAAQCLRQDGAVWRHRCHERWTAPGSAADRHTRHSHQHEHRSHRWHGAKRKTATGSERHGRFDVRILRIAIGSISIARRRRTRWATSTSKAFLPATTGFSRGRMSKAEHGRIRISFASSKTAADPSESAKAASVTLN